MTTTMSHIAKMRVRYLLFGNDESRWDCALRWVEPSDFSIAKQYTLFPSNINVQLLGFSGPAH